MPANNLENAIGYEGATIKENKTDVQKIIENANKAWGDHVFVLTKRIEALENRVKELDDGK